jgi:hypothetical protein
LPGTGAFALFQISVQLSFYIILSFRYPFSKNSLSGRSSTEILHVIYEHFCLSHFKHRCRNHHKFEHVANSLSFPLSVSLSPVALRPVFGSWPLEFLGGSKQVRLYDVGLSTLRSTPSKAGGPKWLLLRPISTNPPGMEGPTSCYATASTFWRSIATQNLHDQHLERFVTSFLYLVTVGIFVQIQIHSKGMTTHNWTKNNSRFVAYTGIPCKFYLLLQNKQITLNSVSHCDTITIFIRLMSYCKFFAEK